MPTTITVNSHTAIADNGLLERLCSICAGLGLAIGLLVLAGYAADFSPAWRVAPGLPATHPLSALSIALLGGGMLGSFARHRALRFLARGAVVLVAAIVTLRILAPWIGLSAFNAITPFGGVIAAQAAAGTPIAMGPNSAQTFLAIAVAEMLRWKNWPTASQLLTGGAIFLLFIALIGYIDDLHVFYGRMAPVTLLGGFTLAVSVLLATHRRGFVRALVARSEPGQVARRLLVPSTSLILLMGWATVHYGRIYGMSVQSSILLAYQTAAIIILSWILVTAATVRADFIDRRRQAAEALLLKAATTDALTGLLSRNELERFRATGEAAQPERSRAELLIDLDRFRAVNEAFGHETGDAFLVEIGQRLQQVGKSYPVGRLGGDEFAIYCTGITSCEAEQIGMAVIAILAMPFNFQGRDFRLTASVGVSYSEPAGQIDLRAAADSAMHVAKNRGGNQVVTFHGAMVGQRRAQIELEQYLHAALDHDEQISLAYQPIVKLSDRSLVAVEALARWVHPLAGLIPPETFIPLAEATGLILPLGWKLMTIAVAQAALWRDQHGDRAPRININISPLQFANGDIIADLKSLLDRHRLSTSAICIEVTEGAFSDNGAIRSLEKARDMGFKVAMDDFGVGYSSLGQLPRLPLATVKLDRSFIVDSTETTRGAIMLASIVQLAHDLNLTVVAEGVETKAQLALVTQVGCDAVQGYFYARPMQGATLEAWLTEKTPRAMRQAEA